MCRLCQKNKKAMKSFDFTAFSILPSRSSSSTHPVPMLNLQVLSSYFIFVSFPPYGTFTVVTFVIRFF